MERETKFFIIFLIFGIILGFAISQIYNIHQEKKALESLVLNIPNKCYTDLQPSNYFSPSKSPITENHNSGYIKIDIKDRNFSISQIKNTGSMRNCISDYSHVIFIEPKIEDIQVGDIINFYCNEENPNIIHRVINTTKQNNETYFLTKGDNNPDSDLMAFKCHPKFEDIKSKVIGVLY